LLDQAIAYGAGAVRAGEVRTMLGTIERGQVFALIQAVHAGDGARLMAEIDRLAEFSPDFAGVLDEVAGALHRVQIKQLVAEHVAVEQAGDAEIVAMAASMPAEQVQLFYQLAITGRRDLPLAPTPRAGFEMTLLRMLAFRPVQAAELPARAPPAKAAPMSAPARVAEPAPAPMQNPPKPQSVQSSNGAAVVHAGVDEWSALIEKAGLRGPAGQLARHAALIGIDGDVVRLALKPMHEHFSSPPLIAQMEDRLSSALGRTVKVRFDKALDKANVADTPADAAAREHSTRQSAAERAMGEDPAVQALIRDFGAHIVPASVKPA
jgi:DNA polymerase-3 subunit gamma/tau